MKICFLGGAMEVGASSILLNVENKNILFDCGIRQSASKDPLPDLISIQEFGGLDAIIVSHAHLDHIGSLPIISKEYPNVRIYMNNMTKDLTKVLLYDSLKIMNNREGEIPLYAEKDVENMLNRIFTINYEVEFSIFDDMKITFYNAGHIAGASSIYLKTKEGAFFYSGDFSIFSQKTVNGAKIPKLRPDIGVFECTYGDKLHSNREIEEEKLVNLVNECINYGGKMLIPAFALGRAQEIILILKKAMNKGKLKKVDIFVDGMIKNINTVYKFNPTYLKNTLGKKILRGNEPFYDDNIKPIENKDQRDNLFEKKEPFVIISSSGMLTGGPSQFYAEKIASMENGYIVISGYQDEEAPGRKLLNLLKVGKEDRILEINNKSIPVKCKIESVGLSAHGDKNEIKAFIDKLTPKNVFMVHGDSEVINSFCSEIYKNYRGRIYAPTSGEVYEINIRNPRKQLEKKLPFIMNEDEELNDSNIELLWRFVLENYYGRLFTVESLYHIWGGSNNFSCENIRKVQNIISNSVYFESDIKRLFLFKARSKEDVHEDLKPKELKPNEINDIVEQYFKGYDYKKISLNMNEKKVTLYFDFPLAVDKSIYDKMKEFMDNVDWTININNNFNNSAAEILIRNLFDGVIVKKISYQLMFNKIVVSLNKDGEFRDKIDQFKQITGLDLEIKNNKSKTFVNKAISNKNENMMEQNAAFNYMDRFFESEEFKPYKKSIKQDENGRYIEVSFITPIVGEKCFDKLLELSKDIGWRIKLSNSCNQNEILNLAKKLCYDKKIELKKNPSFNPMTLEVTLKPVSDINKNDFEIIRNQFKYETGCKIWY